MINQILKRLTPNEMFREKLRTFQVVLNFTILAFMPMIMIPLARSLKIDVPDTGAFRAFLNLMVLMTHAMVYSSIVMSGIEDKRRFLKILIITDIIVFYLTPRLMPIFGHDELVNFMGAFLCTVVLPVNLFILLIQLIGKIIRTVKRGP